MRVNRIELVITAGQRDQLPPLELPELAIAGRSNVGKSSLLNRLLGRKNLAKISTTPGKTQTLNFYRVNDLFYFVDLPGYGFARASRTTIEAWNRLVEYYLKERQTLRAGIHLLDARHPPTPLDLMLANWFRYQTVLYLPVATKVDKLSRNRRSKHFRLISEGLGLGPQFPLVPFSAKTGEGKQALWRIINEVVEKRAPG